MCNGNYRKINILAKTRDILKSVMRCFCDPHSPERGHKDEFTMFICKRAWVSTFQLSLYFVKSYVLLDPFFKCYFYADK